MSAAELFLVPTQNMKDQELLDRILDAKKWIHDNPEGDVGGFYENLEEMENEARKRGLYN
jgi:hypothetical protein